MTRELVHCLVYPDRIDEKTGEQRWHAIGSAHIERTSSDVLLVAHVYRETKYGEKSSASFRPERPKSARSEDIKQRQWTEAEKATVRRIAARQAAGDDSHINFDDIPPLTDEQLARMLRLRDVRPPKIAVSVRLDARVVEWLKSKGAGHLTRINDILANVMDAEQKKGRS